jgi:hypothetical protein
MRGGFWRALGQRGFPLSWYLLPSISECNSEAKGQKSPLRQRITQMPDSTLFATDAIHVRVSKDDDLIAWRSSPGAERGLRKMIEAKTRAYCRPTGRIARYVAFERSRAAWRHEPAEILFYGPDVAESLESGLR